MTSAFDTDRLTTTMRRPTTAAEPPAATPAFAGLCLDCNYPLLDQPPHRCAECGRAFDPADPQTLNTGRPVPAYARFLAGPISWPTYAVSLAGVGVTTWRARLPQQPFSWASPVLWGWVGLALLWLAWPLVRRATLRHYGWPDRVIRPMGRWHWAVPAVMVAMAAAAAGRAVPRAAFALSRADMDRLSAEVLAHPDDAFAERRVGIFWAKNISRVTRRGMRFVADDRDVRHRVGFARLWPGVDAARASRLLDDSAVRPMGGDWWAYRRGG